MHGKAKQFSTEAQLVECFLEMIHSGATPWRELQTVTEWDYRYGFTDVLARTSRDQLIAFEAKLTDWRRASHQAFKNLTFASKAYVVMPKAAAAKALAQVALFQSLGVGLCSVGSNGLNVLIRAHKKPPLIPWISQRAHEKFNEVYRERNPRPVRCSVSNLRQDECLA